MAYKEVADAHRADAHRLAAQLSQIAHFHLCRIAYKLSRSCKMLARTPRSAAYLFEAEKCDEASRRAKSVHDRVAYQALADQWRALARQADTLRPMANELES